jgi:hypothetical protein
LIQPFCRHKSNVSVPKKIAANKKASCATRKGENIGGAGATAGATGTGVGVNVGDGVAVGGNGVAVWVGVTVAVAVTVAVIDTAPRIAGCCVGCVALDFCVISAADCVGETSDERKTAVAVGAAGGTAAGAGGNGAADDIAPTGLGSEVGSGALVGAKAIDWVAALSRIAAGADEDAPPNCVSKSTPITANNNSVASAVAKRAKPNANDDGSRRAGTGNTNDRFVAGAGACLMSAIVQRIDSNDARHCAQSAR